MESGLNSNLDIKIGLIPVMTQFDIKAIQILCKGRYMYEII